MKVIRSRCAGACYGVKRALDQALEAGEGQGRVQTLGPLIHNPKVVSYLEQRGIGVADSPADVDADVIVIRSHGVTPQVKHALEQTGARVVDATCPHVMRAQKAAERLAGDGLPVIVVGEKSHPEVEGLCAFAQHAGGRYIVVDDPDDLPDDLPEKVGIVVQTTQSRDVFDAVCSELEQRGITTVVRDTICNATTQRQEAAAELAAQVDAMVVLGGHNSSNTTRLFEICSKVAPCTFHVEGPDELDAHAFEGCQTVGVTAGASTPEAQIAEVVNVLERW